MIGQARSGEQGSNNWVVDGSLTATGKPILANDPHRPVQIPSLRKTVHLVGPGWNAIGAGEPALPGIALGHNEEIAVGIHDRRNRSAGSLRGKTRSGQSEPYRYRGAWKDVEVERQHHQVKGATRRLRSNCATQYTVLSSTKTRAASRLCAALGGQRTGLGRIPRGHCDGAGEELERVSGSHRSATKFRQENIVYADVDGQYRMAGRRPRAHPKKLVGPVPGAGRYGRIRMDGIPQVPEGFAATLQSAVAFHRHREP